MFDHFVKMALKGLTGIPKWQYKSFSSYKNLESDKSISSQKASGKIILVERKICKKDFLVMLYPLLMWFKY